LRTNHAAIFAIAERSFGKFASRADSPLVGGEPGLSPSWRRRAENPAPSVWRGRQSARENREEAGALLDMRDLAQVRAHVHDAEIEIGEGPEPPARVRFL